MRPTLYGTRHAISAGHYLAAAAGFSVLESGGNAIDAGCAAGIALGVLNPHDVKFAGVAPIMIRTHTGKVVTIDGLGYWPRKIPADLFMREHGGTMPLGILRTVVPAAPDAWITALRDFGTMSFGDVASAAIRIAKEGFGVWEHMLSFIVAEEHDLRKWPANAAIFLPGGKVPSLDDRFIQTDLAGTLQYMADEEAAAKGKGRVAGLQAAHDAFYKGDIAERIVKFHQENGGYLDREDMATFRSKYEPPVRISWRDMDVMTCGPWCQGPVVAHALRMLERAGLGGLAHNSPEYIHLVVEVLKTAFADREYRYGDPAFVDVGMDQLLSDERVSARVSAIRRDRAMPDMPPPLGDEPHRLDWLADYLKTLNPAREGEPAPAPGPRGGDTTYVCAIDRWGNAISATPSDGNWACPVVPGTGLLISTRGVQSRPDPRHPSGVAPGKRPRLTPNPAIAVRDDGSVFTFGTPEGDMQTQAMVQVFLNVFHFGMDLQPAIEAPRFATLSFPNSFQPPEHLPGQLNAEDRIPQGVLDDLGRRGHKVVKWPAYTRKASAVEAILMDRRSGFLRAGADPRQPAYAIVA
jgi:gamma-glutamyltranspeptidase/glutathione hydrolase